MSLRVPLFDLDYDERERSAVGRVLDSKWLTMGDETSAFEAEFADAVGAPYAVAVANCTAALHLAVKAAGIGSGDEVIVPDLTFAATAHAVLYEHVDIRLADVTSAHDLTISVADVERLITPRTRAIIPMHYAGFPCDMGPLIEIARHHGITLIEDAAHAPGATWEGRTCGTIGDIGCFSFFSNKNISTGEGGMLVTNDAEIADRVRRLRCHGMTAATIDRHRGHTWGYDITETGHNYRLTEIEAALGRVQLEKLPRGTEVRSSLFSRYCDRLALIPEIVVPFRDFGTRNWGFSGTSAYHIMVVLLPEGTDRAKVASQLRDAGVGTSVHYRPLHTFSSPALSEAFHNDLQVIESVQGRLLTLPLWASMPDDAVDTVCDALADALGIR